MLLDFSDRTRTGIFNMIWPLAREVVRLSLVKGDSSNALLHSLQKKRAMSYLKVANGSCSRQRPYHVECTSSRPITEVKQRWALLVLGWVTAWEHRVLLAFYFCLGVGVVQLFQHSLSVEALTREAAMIQALGITHILFKSRGSNNVLEVGSKSL